MSKNTPLQKPSPDPIIPIAPASARVNDPVDVKGTPATRGSDMKPEADAFTEDDAKAQKRGETTIVSETMPAFEDETITGQVVTPDNQPGGTGDDQPDSRLMPENAPTAGRVPVDHHTDALHANAMRTYHKGRVVGRFLAGRATTKEIEELLDQYGIEDEQVSAYHADERGVILILTDGTRYEVAVPGAEAVLAQQTAAKEQEAKDQGRLRPNSPRAGRFAGADPNDSTFGARK